MNYLVVDSEFNRKNYPTLIGKVLDTPPAYAEVRKFDGKAYYGLFLVNWQYGGYSYIEQDLSKKPELWPRGSADYASPDEVIRIAQKYGIPEISLAGGYWQQLGYKGYGQKVSIPGAQKALYEAREKQWGVAPTIGLPKETEGENTVGARVIKTLATKTINDITYEQMSRIVRRLGRMSKTDRGIPKRVADVLADEIGPQKALQYIDKALAAGQIMAKEYDEMRAALLLPMPRAEIPAPTIRRMAADLAQGQERLRQDFRKLTGQGQAAFRKPFEAVDKDVKKMRKALGL